MSSLTVRDLGETGVISRILERLPAGPAAELGPGDDAAVVALATPRVLVAADMLVEGRHFDRAFSRPSDVAFKAVAVNVSDIAAMAGSPRFLALQLGLPSTTTIETLDDLADGLAEACGAFGVSVVGGDTVAADVLTVGVTVLGDPGPRVVTRSGARPGDAVCVTGSLGAAAAGLWLLRAATADPSAAGLLDRFGGLAAAHRRGRARIAQGAAAAAAGASAMIDLSDGLTTDLNRICDASGCGAEIIIEALPIADGVGDVAAWAGCDAWDLAASGGDDYELALTIGPGAVPGLAAAIAPVPLTVVGTVLEVERVAVTPAGERLPLVSAGWDHFAEP